VSERRIASHNAHSSPHLHDSEEESNSMVVTDDASGALTVTPMNAVGEALGRLRTVTGLVSASLVEPGSAHVLETVHGDAGDTGPPGRTSAAVVAASASDVVQVLRLMTASLGEADDVEDVIVTLGRHHHVVRPLPEAGVDGLFVVVTLDRGRTNLALARRQLRALGPALGRGRAR
jgi:hypothetical protein